MESPPTLYLIDGYALIYRSYFAFIRNPLRTSRGEDTSAIFGFTNSLLKIVREHRPDYLAVVLDTAVPTFRHATFAAYKATREKMPEDLQGQIPRIREILEAMQIPIIEREGYEADDVIGTLAVKAAEEGIQAVVVSGDKDFYQLVRSGVRLFHPRKAGMEEEWVDEGNAAEKFGVPPGQVVEVLALMGDASDNVPGVPGVGPKTAVKLIAAHGTVEGLLAHLDAVEPERLRELLRARADQARLSRDLVTIRTDVPVPFEPERLVQGTPDEARLRALFEELEFSSLLKALGPAEAQVEAPARYTLVATAEELRGLVGRIARAAEVAVDTETTSLDPMRADLVGISIALEEGEAFYIPIAHEVGPRVPAGPVKEVLGPILASESPRKVGQNVKYDLLVLRRAGMPLRGIAFDPMVASYLLDPGRLSHGLDHLAREFLGHRKIAYEDVTGKGKKKIPFARVPVEIARDYSCEDADYTLRLARLFRGPLHEKGLEALFYEVEMPLVEVLAEMEWTGVAIDGPFFEDLSRRMERDLGALEQEIYAEAGMEFNINSFPQLSAVLFQRLGLPRVKRTKTGYSTDSEVLEQLAPQHRLARLLLDYRELVKLKTTYVDALPRQVNPATGRIHTSFNQTATATGRLSSSDPNLQNIPVRTAAGREIRRGFIPGSPDRLLISCDYSQIELRLAAHLSGDPAMMAAFRGGEDIHRRTAALIFGCRPQDVSPELRARAKEVNFGVIYGMGAFGLSRRMGIPLEEARAFIEGYFRRFSGVRAYLDRTLAEARERGYVTTLLGRRRYLPLLASPDRNVREQAERWAINSPIQGTAADLIKVAMIRIHREIERLRMASRMLIQVHDELVFEVPEEEADPLTELARRHMEGALELTVPIGVDVGRGRNWYECKG